MRVRVVIFQGEIVKGEIENIPDLRIDLHLRQWPWISAQLQLYLFHVVVVYMGITEGMNKVSGLESTHLCHHHGEKGVGGDIERYSEKDVCTSLV